MFNEVESFPLSVLEWMFLRAALNVGFTFNICSIFNVTVGSECAFFIEIT